MAQLAAPEGLEGIHWTTNGRIALITIDRPQVHNAISLATMAEMSRVLDTVHANREIRAIILTGAGNRTFVSGGDLKDFERIITLEAAVAMSTDMQHLTARLHSMDLPVIGAINGDSLGGGCEVALACDIRIASRAARFGFKQVTIGITPAWGGCERLVHLLGRSRALHLMLTGDLIDAEEALRIGFVDRIVDPAEVLDASLKIAEQIASHPPLAVRAIKQMVNQRTHLQGERAIAFEANLFAHTWTSGDHWEALAAKKEKRTPEFRGR